MPDSTLYLVGYGDARGWMCYMLLAALLKFMNLFYVVLPPCFFLAILKADALLHCLQSALCIQIKFSQNPFHSEVPLGDTCPCSHR